MIQKLDGYKDISIQGIRCHVDTVIHDNYNDIKFLSILGYSTAVKEIIKYIKEDKSYYIECCGYSMHAYDKYEVMLKKTDMSDYVHAIIYSKGSYNLSTRGEEQFVCYLFVNDKNELEEKVYDALVKYSSIPILKEWTTYIMDQLKKEYSLDEMVTKQYQSSADIKKLLCYRLCTNRREMLRLVQEGLQNKEINVNGSNAQSLALETCTGIDSYLQLFGEGLAKKIQESFKPKFTPGKDTYSNYLINIDDYTYHNAGINMYEAQRATVQAIAKNMKLNNNTFLVGEMGAGIG